MAKQGQHNNDSNDPDQSRGPNKHKESVVITTGSYKKPETYREQALHHLATNKVAQHDKNEWRPNTLEEPHVQARDRNPRKRHRSGSDSNAS